MGRGDKTYDEIVSDGEELDMFGDAATIRVIKFEIEQSVRDALGGRSTETQYQFFVVRDTDETVLYRSSITTGNHHVTYEGARGRAAGFASGYLTGHPRL
jgi:hypothetical protein